VKKILLNKIVIPAILAATVLIAGMFAFVPVERASTVHTTIQAALQGSSAQTDTIVKATTDVPNVSGTVLLEIKVDQDFTAEIGQFFATVGDATVTIEDIQIKNAADAVVQTIDFVDIAVVVGSQIVFPEDVHSNISLPANWSIVIRGLSASATGDITLMLGIITQGDAVFTLA